jgi:hypothetical protein
LIKNNSEAEDKTDNKSNEEIKKTSSEPDNKKLEETQKGLAV